MTDKKKIGLYVHYPFCSHKCGYCDFNSWASKDLRLHTQQWLKMISAELQFFAEQVGSFYFVDTVFLGGGTPSLMQVGEIKQLKEMIHRYFELDKNSEITMEMNPEDITEDYISGIKSLQFVNRFSMGVQSFSTRQLKSLERQANTEQNHKALKLIQKHWPHRWSFDLMFSLPEQSTQELVTDLELALAYGPKHISIYELTLTTNKSKLWKKPSEKEILEHTQLVEDYLLSHQLRQYEISNFSLLGHESRHNLKYWNLEDYLGIGPGASSLIRMQEDQKLAHHLKRSSRFDLWCSEQDKLSDVVSSQFELRDARIHLEEVLMMGLRLNDGVSKEKIAQLSSNAGQILSDYKALGFLLDDQVSWKTTLRGRRVLEGFLPSLFNRLELK